MQHSPKDHASRSPVNGRRTELDLRLGGSTSDCDDRSRGSSPAVGGDEEPSSAGQWEEGRKDAEEQSRFWRRSACIVAGGKEKEVGEMREALKVGAPCG